MTGETGETGQQEGLDLSGWDTGDLERFLAAGERVREVMRVLANTGDNVVSDILRDQGAFFEWDHYPKGDVFDPGSHAQFYYHAHPESEERGEHGHFHAFLRARGMPDGAAPVTSAHLTPPARADEVLCHLVAISIDHYGQPRALFTTNRWVTGETWYDADAVIAMLGRFVVDHARPSWPVNRWISSMLCLFTPQIEMLVQERDATLAEWAARAGRRNPYEDRRLEIASEAPISVEAQIAALEAELAGRTRPRKTRVKASASRASSPRSRS